MNIEEIFGTYSVQEFVKTHLHRLPFALAGAAERIRNRGSWEIFETVLAEPAADVLVVRNGETRQAPRPTTSDFWRCAINDGCTIRVRHAERHEPQLRQLSAMFEETFESPVDIHCYATPANTCGLSWHYDVEDVFIVQTAGQKEYFLRKNTVNPWPLEETIPENLRYESELMPLMRATLRAGDLLYIPCGYWHRTQTPPGNDVAISLAIGVMSRTAMNVHALLRPKLLNSLVWRQRLPVTRQLSLKEAEAAYTRLLGELAKEVSRELINPSFARQMAMLHRHDQMEQQAEPAQQHPLF